MGQNSNSIRRNQVIQQEARETLKRFLNACSELIPKTERTHFRSDFLATAKTAEMNRKEHEKIARKAGESQEIVEAIMSDYVHFADAFMRILQRTAEAKIPAGSDLNILRDALNLPILYLDYRGFLAKRYGEQPYAAHGKSAVRVAAEALLQYLNMTDGPGPVHSGCRVCGLLMIRKRGGRKYCSTKCSGTAWSYEARKEKLAENRKIHRQRAARELAAINSSKSTAIKKKGA